MRRILKNGHRYPDLVTECGVCRCEFQYHYLDDAVWTSVERKVKVVECPWCKSWVTCNGPVLSLPVKE